VQTLKLLTISENCTHKILEFCRNRDFLNGISQYYRYADRKTADSSSKTTEKTNLIGFYVLMRNNNNNRRRELICLGYFLVATIAFRIWILVIDSYNVYLEVIASIITFFVLVGIYLRIRRPAEPEIDPHAPPRDQREVVIAQILLLSFQNQNALNQGLNEATLARLPRILHLQTDDIESSRSEVDQKCSICLECYVNECVLIKLPCEHDFHEQCILPWLTNHGTCPLCTRPVHLNENSNLSGRDGVALDQIIVDG
jgi:hypothetical protein